MNSAVFGDFSDLRRHSPTLQALSNASFGTFVQHLTTFQLKKKLTLRAVAELLEYYNVNFVDK